MSTASIINAACIARWTCLSIDELPVAVDCASEFTDSTDSDDGRNDGYVITELELSVKACELLVVALNRELASSESLERDFTEGGFASGFAVLTRAVS